MESYDHINFEEERILFIQKESDEQLVYDYILELGNSGWGHARSYHLSLMKYEMIKRGWDISAITNERGEFCLSPEYHCKLEGKRIVLSENETNDQPVYYKKVDDTIESMTEMFSETHPYFWHMTVQTWRFKMFKKLDLLDIFKIIALKENKVELLKRIDVAKEIVKENYRVVTKNIVIK